MTTSPDTGVDLIAVYRLLDDNGPPPVLARHEQQYAAHVLPAEGLSVADLADLLGVTPRTVNRWRAQPAPAVPQTASPADGAWEDSARCREVDAGLFFPPDDGPGFGGYSRARQVCVTCTVRAECLEAALAREGTAAGGDRAGLWGGLSPDQRAALAAARRGAAA